ncbi:MAG: hypothetical protein AAF492_02970 [Verrucomicrobiota bacterium]
MQKIKQFMSLSGLTALEVIRQPICVLLATSCVILIMLLPILISHTLGESSKIIRDSALSLGFVSGLLFGGYAACHILTHEIRRGTAASVLSSPVSREVFFLSKFTGVALVMILFESAVGVTAMMSTRMAYETFHIDWWVGLPLILTPVFAYLVAAIINYRTRKPFASTAFVLLVVFLFITFIVTSFLDRRGQWVEFGKLVPFELVPAIVLVTMAVLILSGLAVSLATRLDVVPTISICSLMFVAGLLSDYVFGQFADTSALAAFFYGLLPNWQHFWMMDALAHEGGIPWLYVAQTGVYSFFYLCGILCFGIFAFRQMDVR